MAKPRRFLALCGAMFVMGATLAHADVSYSTSNPASSADLGLRIGALIQQSIDENHRRYRTQRQRQVTVREIFKNQGVRDP